MTYKKIRINKTTTIDEHRHIMQVHLGRKLEYNEIVHHIDGDKRNNNIENLQVVFRSEHTKTHIISGDVLCLTDEQKKLALQKSRESRKKNLLKKRYKDGKYLCCKCNTFKLPEDFNAHKLKWNGLESQCKICRYTKTS